MTNPTKNLFDFAKGLEMEHLEEFDDYDEFKSQWKLDPKASFKNFWDGLSEQEKKEFEVVFGKPLGDNF